MYYIKLCLYLTFKNPDRTFKYPTMKLEKILDKLGSIEKNSFIKVIDNIISKHPKHSKEIETILSSADKGLKSVDNENISKIFALI